MDAVKFIAERNRMCDSFEACRMCPASTFSCNVLRGIQKNPAIVSIVEQWSKENPRKTQQDVFLEQWQNAARDSGGVVNICPKLLDVDISCTDDETERTGLCKDCDDCRREFWMQEVLTDGC